MQTSKYSNIKIEHRGAGATVTLNRPDKLNPLNWDMVRELRLAIADLNSQPELQTIVLTGSGRSFSAGGDLDKYIGLFQSPEDFRGFLEEFYGLFEMMESSAKIFIAAINGVCVAGGLELLLASDLVVAAEEARIGDGHVNFGQLPGAGGSVRLWRAVGAIRAKQIVLSGELLTAREAQAMGLVGVVAPAGKLSETVNSLVESLNLKSAATLGGAKKLLNEAIRSDYDRALRNEIAYVHHNATTHPDPMEGLMAFKEKRAPRFGVRK